MNEGYTSCDTDKLIDNEVRLNDDKNIIRYLSRKFMPKLLGRNAAELGIAEMISTVHDSNTHDP